MADENILSTPEPEPEDSNNSQGGVNVWGVISIVVFYLAVLFIGLWAGWRQRRKAKQQGRNSTDQEEVMLAGRDIGLFVGILTMGATWVGGGFINGSAQETYKAGLIWTQAPFGYGLSLFISGTFFARKMRDARYVTMIDPFTQKYGKWGALQAIPSAVSEVFWSASILSALGSTLQVILDIENTISIVISAIIAVVYTLMGGLVSVAYTDVFQLFFIAFGLFLALPFAWNSESVTESITEEPFKSDWLGSVDAQDWGLWADYAFLLLLGGIPWQCYYQRVLSSQTSKRAQMLSYGGGLIALIMTAPSVLFGAVAKATDWSLTGYKDNLCDGNLCAGDLCDANGENCGRDDTKLVLPLCLQYLTPTWVAFFGLGAVSAAVMSSTDSSMLSASTMLARNVFKTVFYPEAKEKHVLIALWVLITFNCAAATALAITYSNIYSLFVLCGDFVFVIVFPQLLLVLYYKKANTYGSVFAFFFGLLLRLLCGEPTMSLPPSMSFGQIFANTNVTTGATYVTTFLPEGSIYNVTSGNYDLPDDWKAGPLPFRTFVMLIGLITQLLVTELTYYLFVESKKLSLRYDFFDCYVEGPRGTIEPKTNRFLDEDKDNMEMKDHPSTYTKSSYSNGSEYN